MSGANDSSHISSRLQSILDALPSGFETGDIGESFTDIIEKVSIRKVPVSSLSRMWILGSLKAKIALGYLAYMVRGNFMQETEKQKLLNETNLKSALRLLATMSYLRGTVMKVGQILGNLPEVIPEEIAEVMSTLQFDAPPMHYSMLREVFLDELGKEPEDIFQSFDRQAFAAASFGQVHRAVLRTGEEVAVKIQYPNMAETIRSDLKNLRLLFQPMRLKREQKHFLTHVEDAENMLIMETDYVQEGRFMEQAGALLSGEDDIVIPGYHGEYSSSRVLTMDYIPGCHLRDFMASGPDRTTCNRYGELISKAYIRIWKRSRTLYTDLNPGNFLFMPDGRLGMIDFGSQRKYSEREWRFQTDLESAILRNDVEEMDRGFARACLCRNVEEMDIKQLESMHRFSDWQIEPVLEDKPFDFGNRDFYKRGINICTESIKRGYSRYESVYNWWTRSIMGHRTLMYRLGARFNYLNIYDQEREH